MAEIKGGALFEARLKELSRKVTQAASVRVGFLESATYPDGTPVATVAALQNFGAPARGIPPRPFFTTMVKRDSATWGQKLARLLERNDYNAAAALDLLGQGIAGDLRHEIVQTNAPPLSPITLMLRKMRGDDSSLVVTGATVGEAARRVKAGMSYAGVSTKPLVDSAHMLNSIDSEVD